MSGNGYVQRRRGILGHLQDGRITLLESGAHDVICMLADKASGIWHGSARAFAANCGAGDVSERQARHLLESLEKKGYIRRFPTPRAHGNYPILINRYEVTFGAQSGMRLNAIASMNWRRPVYESCPEHGAEQGPEHGAERAPYQEGEGEERPEKRRVKTSAAAQPADPRHQLFVDFAYEAFRKRHTQAPTWSNADYKCLKSLLKNHPSLTVVELSRRFTHFLDSTEPFTVSQGSKLGYFATNCDRFIGGPIHAGRGPGKAPAAAHSNRIGIPLKQNALQGGNVEH